MHLRYSRRASSEPRYSSDSSGQTRGNDDQSSEKREYLTAYQSISAARTKGSRLDLLTDSGGTQRSSSASRAKSKTFSPRRRQGDELVSIPGYSGLTIGQLTREVSKGTDFLPRD